MAKNIGIIYCQRIQDASCIGCAKCYKAVREHDHAFADVKDDIQVVFKTGCGDCPGLVLPKLELQMCVLEKLGVRVDEIYFGTCVKKATAVMNCPMNLSGIESKTGGVRPPGSRWHPRLLGGADGGAWASAPPTWGEVNSDGLAAGYLRPVIG